MESHSVQTVEAIGKLVRAERRRHRLNQGDFAAFCGVGRRFVSELENGKPTIEAGKVLEILAALGFDIRFEKE